MSPRRVSAPLLSFVSISPVRPRFTVRDDSGSGSVSSAGAGRLHGGDAVARGGAGKCQPARFYDDHASPSSSSSPSISALSLDALPEASAPLAAFFFLVFFFLLLPAAASPFLRRMCVGCGSEHGALVFCGMRRRAWLAVAGRLVGLGGARVWRESKVRREVRGCARETHALPLSRTEVDRVRGRVANVVM